jgi:glycosyltransferase involved in cell wall biosynthesis
VTQLRVAIVADYLEEGWPSMDLVANMLVDRLRAEHSGTIEPMLIRPALRRRVSRLPGASARAEMADRIANRLWDYPRVVAAEAEACDLFHIVDHSYAQLVHRLPAERTLVTCHDLDTFRSVLDPELEPRSSIFRAMTRHILDGLRKAAHIACDTAATRDDLVRKAGIDRARTSVVPNGPHPSCSPLAEPAADAEAARLLGGRGSTYLLHVGSTIARKRIDVLLRVVAAVRAEHKDVRLVRVGGPFTAEQRVLVRELGLDDAVVQLPFVDRSTLASIYRRSALVLQPSAREGFGLPVLEALASGTPVVASDIDALREVGANAVEYCVPDDVEGWARTVARLLAERDTQPDRWRERRDAGIERASAFSWSRYTNDVVALYRVLVSESVPGSGFRVPGSGSGSGVPGSGSGVPGSGSGVPGSGSGVPGSGSGVPGLGSLRRGL